MAILSDSDLVAAIASAGIVPIYKASVANMAAGYLAALWRAVGSPLWGQGAIPAAAATPTDATAGGILLPAFGANTGYVLRFAPVGATVNTFLLYDRLAHMGGLVGNVATSQTVNLNVDTALAAGRCRSDRLDVDWFVEIYTDLGTTASNLTVTYTDVNDVGSKTVVITGFTGTSPLNRSGRCVQLVPSDGVQIKSIQSAILSISSGTAGSFGLTARRRLCAVSQMVANIMGIGVDGLSLGLPTIAETACLEMLVQCSTTSTGLVMGEIVVGQK